MTYEEALYYMTHNGATSSQETMSYSMMITAMEKQIPKKVIPFETNPYLDACPCCGRIKSIYGDRYCSYCGQRINWNGVR